MKITAKSEYTSIACNRTPEIVDWNSDGVICFGAANAVVLYDTKQKGGDALTVLSHHKSVVNSVKWLRKPNTPSIELVSCSADKTAAIWTKLNGAWCVTSLLEGHTDGVTCISGLYVNENDVVVYTGSIDSTVRVWERCDNTTVHKQTINLHSGLCLTIHAHLLPKVCQPILFCALDDHKIHIFAMTSAASESGDIEEYHRLHSLAGHEDWVRGFDVMDVDNSGILLASASQDTYIRLWRIQHYLPDHQPTTEIKVEQKLFSAYGDQWSAKLDAVLAGHEGWVYGVQFAPSSNDQENKTQPNYRLLSSSLDKTLIIWKPDTSLGTREGQGAWVERVRVGEVGGNGLGFYGGRFGPQGTEFMGHGYNGSFHIWRYNKDTTQWVPSVVCGGHYSAVEDVRWEPKRGRYLLSVSTDQTTRVHAPWSRDGCQAEWHEIARPQVHGYDLGAVAPVSSTVFAAAAEEKVVRVFRAPHNFLDNFRSITGELLVDGMESCGGAEGASVPSLGLSNKAVFSDDNSKEEEDDNDGYFVPVVLSEPPTEETLMQNTLWPEVQKLYGHGYEVFALDASPDGALVASACKANSAEHAKPIIWETTNWQQIQQLPSHQLTVTQLAFSPDSQRLLSVSRDRRWTLFQRRQGSDLFDTVAATDKTNGVHSRIIWCCAWAHDCAVFATGSRDGKVCVWSETQQASQTSLGHYALLGKPLELTNTSVTAVAFAPLAVDGARVVATGFESGVIRIYSFVESGEWNLLLEMDKSTAHHLTVKRLVFNPRSPGDDGASKEVLLASCGSDHLVRIYNISIVST